MEYIFYTRVSTIKQSSLRQIANLKEFARKELMIPEDEPLTFYSDEFTGTTMNRPQWDKMMKYIGSCLKKNQEVTICFDSVCRMSRNAEEGCKAYFDFVDKGVSLIFLKERMIDTSVYIERQKDVVAMTGDDVDIVLEAINKYQRRIAQRQIEIAFQTAEKEVTANHIRIREALKQKKAQGYTLGRKSGEPFVVRAKEPIKEIIADKIADGYKDIDIIKIINQSTITVSDSKGNERQKPAHISRGTYYKYKKETIESIITGVQQCQEKKN